MRTFVGTKVIKAAPMTRREYYDYRGWEHPVEEDLEEAGQLVEYTDGGKPNDERHEGYISWSPNDAFDKAYRPADNGVPFGMALDLLKAGRRVARIGWNGKDMFVFLVAGSHFKVNRPPLLGIYEEGTGIDYRPHIDMKTAQGDVVPWVASQSDLIEEDWVLVD